MNRKTYFKDIEEYEKTTASLFVNEDTIILMGSINENDPVVQESIDEAINEIFKYGHETVSVISTNGSEAYSVFKKGSSAFSVLEEMLGIEFESLGFNLSSIPDFIEDEYDLETLESYI